MSSGQTVGGTVREYLEYLVVERGLAANTVESYRRDLDRYQSVLAARGTTGLGQVTPADVAEFLASLREGDADHQPLAVSSAARAVIAVRDRIRMQAADGDHRPGRRTDRQRRVLGVALAQRGQELGHVGRGDVGQPGLAAPGQYRVVPAQVAPVGLDRIRGQPALHDQVLQVAADRTSQRGRRLAQLSTWLSGV